MSLSHVATLGHRIMAMVTDGEGPVLGNSLALDVQQMAPISKIKEQTKGTQFGVAEQTLTTILTLICPALDQVAGIMRIRRTNILSSTSIIMSFL